MEEKHHTSLATMHFCPQIHLYSQRIIWETLDNGYSVWFRCPALQRKINASFIFRHKCAWMLERNNPKPWKHHDAGNETNQLHRSPARLVLSFSTSTPLCKISLCEKRQQTAVPWPRGGKEPRTECEFIHGWQTCRAAVQVAPTCLLDLLPAYFFTETEFTWTRGICVYAM